MNSDQRRHWMRVVLSHTQLTAAQKTVLIALETYADYQDGTNAYPGEENLATVCGLTLRPVRNALARGRELGLIERTQVANHRAGRADVYRLVPTTAIVGLSAPADDSIAGTDEPVNEPITGLVVPVKAAITGAAVPVDEVITGSAVHDYRLRHDSFTGSAEPPTLPSPSNHHSPGGLRNRGTSPERQAFAHTPKRPSRFCINHPIGTGAKCPDCQNAREHQKAWDAVAAEADVAEAALNDVDRAHRQQIIANCPYGCAENFGRIEVIGADGVERLAPCTHGPRLVASNG